MCVFCFRSYSLLPSEPRNKNLAQEAAATLRLAGSHGTNGSRILAAEALGLACDAGDVRLASNVPHGDVLIHAAGQTSVLLGRERSTGGRDAGGEAVLVDFLGAVSWVLGLLDRGGDVLRSERGR
jgi:hypothetical protein